MNQSTKLQEPLFALPLDTIIHGRFLVGRVLGVGGFGITYQGQNLNDGKFVAIKEYYPNGHVSRKPGTTKVEVIKNYDFFLNGKEKFLQEARIIYHCHSENILSIYSLFEENGTAYYVMEFLEGRDLMQYLKKQGGKIQWAEMKYITFQIMDALEYVHREGIIHRDISPDNIYLCSDNRAKLIDFGTARNVFENKSLSIILKKGYAPPEQYISRGRQGAWTDVYALGATMYRAMTGVLPLEATERMHNDTLVPIKNIEAKVPEHVSAAVEKAMKIRETERFQNISEFKEALKEPQKNLLNKLKATGRSYTETISEHIHLWSAIKPTLVGISGVYAGQKFDLDQDIIIGRDPSNCNIVFPRNAADINAVHCQICLNVGGVRTIIDCDSTYGTFLNGVKLYPGQMAVLQSGSKIKIGLNNVFVFYL